MPIVLTENLTRVYGKGGVSVDALSGVNISVETGEFLSLVGPSGSGKTTLLNIIGGLDEPTSGRVIIDGLDTTALSASEMTGFRLRRVGFVFQEFNLIPVLTARENIEYVMLLQGVAAAERNRRISALMIELGLEGLADRKPAELSGGQKQRVAVARAVVSTPALVLADEPTANLDSKTGASLMDLMRRLNTERSITFIFSTHDPLIMERAERVLTLHDGRVVEDTGIRGNV